MAYEAYYNLPNQVVYCKRCVISNQRPSSSVEFKNKDGAKQTIGFDSEGICSACRYHEHKAKIDWKEREKQLIKILDDYRRNDGRHDVIVPSSGGKDSSFTAHVLKYKYGMNPLTVTWAPHLYTEVGWRNLTSLAHKGGLDNILFTPNGRLHRILAKEAFLNLGHPFQPFIHGQKTIGPHIAAKFDIPLIVYGENQAEYGNAVEENLNPLMNSDFFTSEQPDDIYLGGKHIKDLMREYKLGFSEFAPYLPSSTKVIRDKNIKMMYLGFFERWDPQEMYYYAAENTGFQSAEERSSGTYSKYTEIDDKFVPIHFHTMFIKFGIGRATYDAAQEIRNEKIDRDEGVVLVEKYDSEFPAIFHQEFLEYLDLSEQKFQEKIDSLRSPHLWAKVNGEWKIRHTVGGRGCDD